MRRRKDKSEPVAPVADRAWSARTNMHARDAALVRFSPLPAETGPTWAPDKLSVWPVEGGRFGIDATYHGSTGAQRAERQLARLTDAGLAPALRREDDGGATLRLGPLAHEAAWLALEAFLGRRMDAAP
ncbi:MAG: hypothetical protein QOJ35_836 [Solirubrobacteraceae bacterium]|jgi:hypothetical protein|nr:hypothetical protein [Solirubrobacteraceae bacterium]